MKEKIKHYKLTDKNNRTYGGLQWGENVTHKANGDGYALCTSDVIHVYDHPLKAVMFNPIHADFKEYNLWECKVRRVVANDTFKVGVKQCTTIQQVDPPRITTEQKVRFAIYCALEVYQEAGYVKWAQDWLSGKDRTAEAAWTAEAAARAAEAAAGAARAAEAAAWTAEAAEAAAGAAEAAARAAEAAEAAAGAARAAEAAAWTAEAAKAAAGAAKGAKIDWVALIKKAMLDER